MRAHTTQPLDPHLLAYLALFLRLLQDLFSFSASESGARAAAAAAAAAPLRIALLGDSTFDNAAYIGGQEHGVRSQLERVFGSGAARVDLLAVDAAVTESVLEQQVPRVPRDATHVLLSVGGNDALHTRWHLESARIGTAAEALLLLYELQSAFESRYRGLVSRICDSRQPPPRLMLVVPYWPRFGDVQDSEDQRVAHTGMALYADVILREATSRGLPVLALRASPQYYANPIKPSAAGGAAMAAMIKRMIDDDAASPLGAAQVYGR